MDILYLMKYLPFRFRYFMLFIYFKIIFSKRKREELDLTIHGLQKKLKNINPREIKRIAYRALNEIPIRYALTIALFFEKETVPFMTTVGMKQLNDRIGKESVVIVSSHLGAYTAIFPLLVEHIPLNIIVFKETAKEYEILLLRLKRMHLPVKAENINFIEVPSVSGMKALINSFDKKEIIFFLIDTDVGMKSRNGPSFDFLLGSLQLPISIFNLIIRYNAYFTSLTVQRRGEKLFNHFFEFTFKHIDYKDSSSLIGAYKRLLNETNYQIIEKPELWTLWMYQDGFVP